MSLLGVHANPFLLKANDFSILRKVLTVSKLIIVPSKPIQQQQQQQLCDMTGSQCFLSYSVALLYLLDIHTPADSVWAHQMLNEIRDRDELQFEANFGEPK